MFFLGFGKFYKGFRIGFVGFHMGFMNIFSEKKNIENSAYILVRSEECRAINKDFEIQNNLNILPGKLQASASYRKEVMFNVIQLSN